MTIDRASELYNRIVQNGETAIDDLILTRESESYFLDFKRSSDSGLGHHLSQTDRKNFAKAISGYGNAEGGLLIWGVDCSDAQDQADVAQTKHPLADAAAFKARLEGVVSGCTVPPHQLIACHAIVCAEPPSGYVATYIPKSVHAPHQMVPDLRYFMRSGSAFVPVPHGVLAGMFGRRPQPHVFSNYILAIPEVVDGLVNLDCGISAYNDGPGIARDLFVVVTVLSTPGPNCEFHFELTDQGNWTGGIAFGVRLSLVSNDGYKVAPDSHVQPAVFHARFAPPFDSDIKVDILLGCEGAPPHRAQWVSSRDDVEAAFNAVIAGQIADPHDAAAKLLGVPSEGPDED